MKLHKRQPEGTEIPQQNGQEISPQQYGQYKVVNYTKFKSLGPFKKLRKTIAYRTDLAIELSLGVLCAILDVFFATGAVAYVLRRSESDPVVVAIAIGLDLLGLAAAIVVGKVFFSGDEQTSAWTVFGIVSAIIWVLVGTALAVMRAQDGESWLQVALLVGLYVFAGVAGLAFSSVASSKPLGDFIEGREHADYYHKQLQEMILNLQDLQTRAQIELWDLRVKQLVNAKSGLDKAYSNVEVPNAVDAAIAEIGKRKLFPSGAGTKDEREELWADVKIDGISYDPQTHQLNKTRYLYQ